MNERINKLFGQAMDQSIPETWTTLTHSQLSILKDKFAELIVKECADLCEHEYNDDEYDQYDMGMSVKAESIKTAIKQHFGVEE